MRGPHHLGGPRRLPARADYDRVFAQPDFRLRREPFTLLARYRHADGAGAGEPRLGLVVGRRHARRAVDRSRIKRQVRESFRLMAPSLPAIDVVVLARPGAGATPAAGLRASLDWLWQALAERAAPASGDGERS